MSSGKYTERRLSGLLKMEALTAGESSHTHRVRAATEVNDWFKTLTAEERGQIVTAEYDRRCARNDGAKAEGEQRGKTTGVARVVAIHKPLKGKPAELRELLRQQGAEMVAEGNRYAVKVNGETLGTFAGATGGALLTREGMLIETAPGRWTLTPEPLT